MEYRQLGRSGLRISTLTMGTMTFGGKGWAKTVGDLGVKPKPAAWSTCASMPAST
jgi:aryl-alcohol dehydrogenase-like predicted oxidoreductase